MTYRLILHFEISSFKNFTFLDIVASEYSLSPTLTQNLTTPALWAYTSSDLTPNIPNPVLNITLNLTLIGVMGIQFELFCISKLTFLEGDARQG